MGIQGLLPFLKKIHTEVNIAQFAGSTVAIDAYCWLHKGAFSCAEKLALGEKTDQYVYYCMKYVEYLLKHNLKPIMVFDGCHLKSKANVEKNRREKRELHRKKAAQFLREGRRAEAKECLQRCIDITPQMALDLMNVCRSRGVDCIVAPYEADAQLAYLNLKGIAQIIVTEDSDLLLFGCEKVIFKMDFTGRGVLIEKSRLNEVLDIQGGFFTFEKFRYMCILSGCDYLPSLTGIGLAKACKVMRVARQTDVVQLLKKLPNYLKMNVTVTTEYIDGFVRANNTFLYQLVFDPLERIMCPLNPYPSDIDETELDYAGQYLPQEKAYQIALGNTDIHTHKTIANFNPDTFKPSKHSVHPRYRHQLSIWDKNYRIKTSSPCKEIQSERTSLHNTERTVKINLFQKKSPRKRPRPSGDGPDGNNQDSKKSKLMDAENAMSLLDHAEEIPTVTPTLVHQASDEPSSESQQNDSDDTESDEDSETSGKAKDFKVKHIRATQLTAANIGEEVFKQESIHEKENSEELKSPVKRNNIFAKPGDAAQPSKFNVNARAVEVRSRFFAKSPQKQPKMSPVKKNGSPNRIKVKGKLASPSDTDQPKINLMLADTLKRSEIQAKTPNEVVRKTELETKKGKTPSNPILEMFKYAKTKTPSLEQGSSLSKPKSSVTPKSRSAFSWSSFKNSGAKNATPSSNIVKRQDFDVEDPCADLNIEQSQGCKDIDDNDRNPCETLSSLSPLSSYFTPSSRKSTTSAGQRSGSDESKEEVKELKVVDYSSFLKSMCDDSQEEEEGGSKSKTEEREEEIADSQPLSIVSDLSQRSSIGSIDSFCLPSTPDLIDLTDTEPDSQDSTKGTTPRAQQASKRPTCKVSGLSRRSGKKGTKFPDMNGQQKISSLARFAFVRNASPARTKSDS